MVALVIVAYVAASVLVAFLGRRRMFGFWGYFFCSLLLSPILGLLFVIASGKPQRRQSPYFGL